MPQTDGARAKPAEGPIPVEVDPDLFPVVPMFLENRRGDVESLREAVRTGDAETVEDIGHAMKGTGGAYGFDYVTTAGGALERLAREGKLGEAAPWIDGLADYLERVEPREGPETE